MEITKLPDPRAVLESPAIAATRAAYKALGKDPAREMEELRSQGVTVRFLGDLDRLAARAVAAGGEDLIAARTLLRDVQDLRFGLIENLLRLSLGVCQLVFDLVRIRKPVSDALPAGSCTGRRMAGAPSCPRPKR